MVSSKGVAGMQRSSQCERVVAEQVMGCWFSSADQARIFPFDRESIRTFGRPGARMESSIWPDSIQNKKGCDSPSRKRTVFGGDLRRFERFARNSIALYGRSSAPSGSRETRRESVGHGDFTLWFGGIWEELPRRIAGIVGGEKRAWKWILGGKAHRETLLCPEQEAQWRKKPRSKSGKTL